VYILIPISINVSCIQFSCSCRGQLVSFMSSCLGCPDMFETNSLNSVKDLFAIISDDSSPTAGTMLKDLVQELEKQEFLTQVYARLG